MPDHINGHFSVLKKDRAYTMLNLFWIMVGVVGIFRATNFIH